MDIIKHCLERFAKIVAQQECTCDETYGIHCTVHDDQRFAPMALEAYAKLKEAQMTNANLVEFFLYGPKGRGNDAK